jgi:peptidyl-prolyl cis-trans isomerase D
MLQAIRTRAGGIIVKVLFGLLILSFGFWGIYTRSPFFQDKSPDAAVATVGSRDIRADTLQAALQPALERLRAQLGSALDPAQIKQLGVVDAVLDQIIDR